MEINLGDSYLTVSSKLLIKGKEANQTVTPNCSIFIPMFVDGKIILGCFKKLKCLDISIFESLAFLFYKFISTSNECFKVRFCYKNWENLPLKHRIFLFQNIE